MPQCALLIKLTDLWFMGFVVAILWTLQVGVHWNQFFKFRPEPDPTGTGKKFRPEVPAGTGTNILSHIQSYVTLSAARQADTSSHQGESSQMLE